ncbi:DNA primase [Mangrovihabitans endophyticus]|uniref:DNA primase/polymerase bifunctional N-terminal domain-containing protein n=1 Tax=Mangrovihabitans endophyticus TaxID=1751298 RepID=A0A8J3FNM9_9ACTN|nr:DNA primase [Mangrovihabitans endophyticus]GGK88207.1 hypothetical protein GCM10012284_22850 [Mangrovihabitans endophyticus]
MSWTNGRPPGPVSALTRMRLRRAAARYARQGWAVLPGRHPHALLLPTGLTFDAIEVPSPLGLRALGRARLRAGLLGDVAARGPVASTPSGRWMFLTQPGVPLRPELRRVSAVALHGSNSWIPAPPSRVPGGMVRWMVAPELTGWRLPTAVAVQTLLIDALATLGTATRNPGRPMIPRQLSTTRRAE